MSALPGSPSSGFARAVFGTHAENVVLASRSPRRRELCERLGLTVEVRPSDIDERRLPAEPPVPHVERLAREKCAVAVRDSARALVVAADTIVVLDEDILGKPADGDEAVGMLHRLSGRTHEVVTGVAVQKEDRLSIGHEVTRVSFRRLGAREIHTYVESGEPLDKAGSYGAQALGAAFIERIEGCYYNVVGLPLARLVALVRALDAPTGQGEMK